MATIVLALVLNPVNGCRNKVLPIANSVPAIAVQTVNFLNSECALNMR